MTSAIFDIPSRAVCKICRSSLFLRFALFFPAGAASGMVAATSPASVSSFAVLVRRYRVWALGLGFRTYRVYIYIYIYLSIYLSIYIYIYIYVYIYIYIYIGAFRGYRGLSMEGLEITQLGWSFENISYRGFWGICTDHVYISTCTSWTGMHTCAWSPMPV